MKIKYNGKNFILCDFPSFMGIVSKGDIIDVSKELFNDKLKNYIHNDKPVWIEEKAEKPAQVKEEDLKT